VTGAGLDAGSDFLFARYCFVIVCLVSASASLIASPERSNMTAVDMADAVAVVVADAA
jgi:hypothetical protein